MIWGPHCLHRGTQCYEAHLNWHVGQSCIIAAMDEGRGEGWFESRFVEARERLPCIGRLEFRRHQVSGKREISHLQWTVSNRCTVIEIATNAMVAIVQIPRRTCDDRLYMFTICINWKPTYSHDIYIYISCMYIYGHICIYAYMYIHIDVYRYVYTW